MARKTAICVGQNNYDPASGVTPLQGCINDALLIGEMLRTAGFAVRQLHDAAATQQQILSVLETEIAKLRDGDYLVFWNSSHGYQVRDYSPGGEEFDYMDEAICCYDNNVRDPLIDDKFQRILSRVAPGAKVFIGSDSCHSGTVTRRLVQLLTGIPSAIADEVLATRDLQAPSALDLAWEIIARDATVRSRVLPEVAELGREFAREIAVRNTTASEPQISPPESQPNTEERRYSQALTRDAGLVRDMSINDPIGADWQARLFFPQRADLLFDLGQDPLNLNSYIPDGEDVSSIDLERYSEEPQVGGESAPESSVRRFGRLARRVPEEAMSHLLLSGCLAEEVSWDAPFPQGRHGAMTYYFAVVVLEAWKRGEAITYRRAHQEALARLRRRFNQTPQLEGPDRLKDELVFGYLPQRRSSRDYMEDKVPETTSTSREHTKERQENIRQTLDAISRTLSSI